MTLSPVIPTLVTAVGPGGPWVPVTNRRFDRSKYTNTCPAALLTELPVSFSRSTPFSGGAAADAAQDCPTVALEEAAAPARISAPDASSTATEYPAVGLGVNGDVSTVNG